MFAQRTAFTQAIGISCRGPRGLNKRKAEDNESFFSFDLLCLISKQIRVVGRELKLIRWALNLMAPAEGERHDRQRVPD